MNTTILNINPINWFNYKGHKNIIDFSEGTNIIVGTNNAGKTKLHNAFRFILTNQVVLKLTENDKQVYRKIEAENTDYIFEILNKRTYAELKLNDTCVFGVELTFKIKSNNQEPKTYLIKKLIKIRKLSDSKFDFIDFNKEVYSINRFTEAKQRLKEDADERVKWLILPAYRDFFLIEGEQMGMMTPLKGNGLKQTIKSLTDINSIDRVVDNVDSMQKKVKADKNKHESEIEELTDDQRKLVKEIIDKEGEIERQKENITEITIRRDEYDDKIGAIQEKYNESKAKKELLSELIEMQDNLKVNDNDIDSTHRKFLDSLTDNKNFNLSKLFNENHIGDELEKLDKKFGGYLRERKIELQKDISEENQELLNKLVRTEPHPALLKDMLNDKIQKCYICKSSLENENVDYIKNILIPHYEEVDDSNDNELNNLSTIKDSILEILHEARSNFNENENLMKDHSEEIASLERKKLKIKKEIAEFIEINGDEADLSNIASSTTMAKFHDYSVEKGKADKMLEDEKIKLAHLQGELKKLKEDKKSKNIEESDKTKTFNQLYSFINKLDDIFENTKKDIYDDFAAKLQTNANSRYKKLMRNNPTVKNHKLVVKSEKKIKGFKSEYNFEVYLQDKFGEKLSQEGGASSTLEPLSVVFGLIDQSQRKKAFPFIADAPISRLTEDTKFSFFETIIDDEILAQNIIICMDLWDNIKGDINELGKSVLKLISNKSDASFILLEPKENNSGVEIINKKNGN